jgi:O-antigen ligase
MFSAFYRISPILGSVAAIAFMSSYNYLNDHLVGAIDALGMNDYMRVNTLQQGSGRFVAWDFCWKHIQESYWFGRGFEYTEYLFNIPANVYYLQTLGHQGNAHNSFITLWLDTGLVGLSTFVLALASCFFSAIKKTRLALPLMYASLFSSFFESWLTASLNPFTIMLFITLAIITSNVIIPSKAPAALPVQ